MEQENKSWYASKGVWGGILAVAASVAGIFGFTFGVELQEQVVSYITQLIGVIGGLLAIFGRVTAKQPIGNPDVK
jgi:uncharacterized membrane protein